MERRNFLSYFDVLFCRYKVDKWANIERQIQYLAKLLKWIFFVKTVNGWKALSTFAKSTILNVWQSSEYAPDTYFWKAVI